MKRLPQVLLSNSSTLFRIAAITALLCLPAVAAETTATLSGAVKDSTGAVIAKAPITLTNVGTNISKNLLSGDDGFYLFTLVPIGTYRLSVEQPGFRKYVREGIVLNVNQNAKLDIALQVGAASQEVNVTGDVTQVDTQSATLGSVETTRRILDLPLVERDTFQLGLLQAGVFPPDDDDGSGNPFSVSGQRSESLSFLINGSDNNDFLGNNAVVDPNPDAVAEFKILTNNYEAEYGRTSGGIVNQVIKSGTNAFHGDVFEFFRNDALNARNYFLPSVTPFKRNTFGGTLGGPLRKDKTFFFIAYQGERKHEGQIAPVLQVLSPAERTGDFSELLAQGTQLVDPTTGLNYPNNQVPVNPVIKNYIAKYLPLPNLPNNQFVSSPITVTRDDQGIIRIDHHIGQSDSIFGSYIIDDLGQSFPFRIINGGTSGGNVPIGSGFDEPIRTQLGTFSWLHNFGPKVINEFIFGANRSATLTGVPHDRTPPSALGFTNVNPDDPAGAAPPIMITTTFNLGPNPGGPTTFHDVTFHWQDSISMTRGRHNIKFGTDIRRVRNNFHFDFDNNGVFDFGNFLSPFTGSTLADFVGGFYDNYSQFSRANYGIRTTSWHFFGQDSWKILPRLTLSYGMRYEYNTPLEDPHDEILGFFPGQQSTRFPGAPTGILYPGDPGTPNRGLTYPDRNNFAPRFGFAWDMLGNAKLVMRGGIGIFYDLEDGALNEQFGGQSPFGFVTNLNPAGYTNLGGIDPVADPFTAFSASPNPYPSGGKPSSFGIPKISFAYVADPHFRTPYSENVNYGLQYQLTKDAMIETDYVGTFSRKSIVSADVNPPLPGILKQQYANAGFTYADCARPLAGCSDPTNPNDPNSSPTQSGQLITDLSAGSSDSHQFQLTVDKRFSQGFNIRGAYTLAKTIDTQSGFRYNTSLFTDPFNFSFDRGLSNFDVTHRVVISGIWELPLDRPFRNGNGWKRKLTEGWEASGIASFQSGTPFTIFSNANSSQEATGFDRADLVGPTHIFNPRTLRSFDATTANCLGQTTPAPGASFYFDPTAYDCSNVPLFTFGNSGRNSVRGPGRNNFDLTIGRTFKFGESKSVEFRSEFFNAFNHAQFMNPDHGGGSSTFGQITQARDPRILQLALKMYF
jgi:Carboxypeptidase regulatory-like domain